MEKTQAEYNTELAMKGTILRGLVGSETNGLAGPDSDTDYIRVFIEPPEHVFGPKEPIPSFDIRTAKKNQKSGPGDIEERCYSLRRFMDIVLKGSPRLMPVLFSPYYSHQTQIGRQLCALAPSLVSQKTGQAYRAAAASIYHNLVSGDTKNQRPELIAKHGYDTKYAAHGYLIALQGLELMIYSRLLVPLRDKGSVKAILAGQYSVNLVAAMLKTAVDQLEEIVERNCMGIPYELAASFLQDAHTLTYHKHR